MVRVFIIFSVFLTFFAYSNNKLCSCYEKSDSAEFIRYLVNDYLKTTERWFLFDLPPYRAKWESEYFKKMKGIKDLWSDEKSLRYTDVYNNILLCDQRIEIMTEYWHEYWYNLYMEPGWAYKINEKEHKIEKERKRVLKNQKICKDNLCECKEAIMEEYIILFEECLHKNDNLITYCDYGNFSLLNNNINKSFDLLLRAVEIVEKTNRLDELNSQDYHHLGQSCVEVMAYAQAIEYPSEAIKKDPTNKTAYFDRALA